MTVSVIRGTDGGDDLLGTSGNDNFLLWQGGNDFVDGGGGNDIFRMGAALNAGDNINGGTGNDVIILNGDYSAGVVFNAGTITNIEAMGLAGGHSYNLTLNDGNVAAGQRLLVKAQTLGAGDHLTFDGSAETDGKFYLVAGAGDDTLTGGARHDVFDLSHGGSDTAHGGGGNDTFNMGAAFDSGDQIDGGAGSDTLELNGDYSASTIIVSGAMVQNVETVTLAGSGFSITWDSAIGSGLTVDASAIGSGKDVTFDSSALDTGNVHFIAGASLTIFTGGGGDDVVDLQNNTDSYFVIAASGDDTVNFGAAYGTGGFLSFLDTADGGGGSNTATFDGDYLGGLTLGPETGGTGLSNYQTVKLLGDHSYTVTFDDTQGSGFTLTGGASLTVDASALGSGDHAVLDFSLSAAPAFTVTGSAGDDTITFAANFSASDAIDGGAGNNVLKLNGDYSAGLTFGASTMTNFETLMLGAGHDYKITTNDATVASGATLTVDFSVLTDGSNFTFEGQAEADGNFRFVDGAAGVVYIDGGDGNDVFDLTNAGTGTITLHGNGGDDTVLVGANFNNLAPNTLAGIDGGTGNNTLEFNGDYASVSVGSGEGHFGTIVFDGGHSYGSVSIGQLAAPSHVTIDASQVATLFTLTFRDNTTYTIDVGSGGMVTTPINDGGVSDTFVVNSEAALGASQLNAGNGNGNVLELNGDFATAFTFGATTISSIATIKVDNGHSYDLVENDGNLAAGHTMTVNGSALTGSNALIFDGSSEQDGHFTLIGGAGNDILSGGQLNDTITGGGGADTLDSTGDFDIFNYNAVSDSNTATGYDAIHDFSSTTFLHFGNGDHPTYFGSQTVSTDQGSLDADLGSVLSGLTADHYAVVTVTNSADTNINNHVFLVVDPTGGTSGYVGGSDYVIDITGFSADPASILFT